MTFWCFCQKPYRITPHDPTIITTIIIIIIIIIINNICLDAQNEGAITAKAEIRPQWKDILSLEVALKGGMMSINMKNAPPP